MELKEPICATVYPGNSVVTVSYKKFVKDNNLVRGIIVDDKGFPVNTIRELLAQTPNLHYLTPIKRNDKRIEKYDVLKFTELQMARMDTNYKKWRSCTINVKEGL